METVEAGVMPINPRKKPWVVMIETGLSKRIGLRIMDGEMTMTFYEMIDGEITQISRVLSYDDWKTVLIPHTLDNPTIN